VDTISTLFSALVFARTFGRYDHLLSIVALVIGVVIATVYKRSAWWGVRYGIAVVCIHEGTWDAISLLRYWALYQQLGSLSVIAGSLVVLLIFGHASVGYYHTSLRNIVRWLGPTLLFFIGWFAVGFPVTTLPITTIYAYTTPLYHDFATNAWEVLSWLITTSTGLLALRR
jgi:hypothetical protein